MNPYQMAAREGKYYLICNYDKYDTVSNYRIDRILDLKVLADPVKPFESLKGSSGQALDLASYMKEHPYMYAGSNVHVKFRMARSMIGDMLEVFGKEVKFSEEDEAEVTAVVRTNEMAAEQFAKNYAPDVIILEPKRLRERVKEGLKKGLNAYGDT